FHVDLVIHSARYPRGRMTMAAWSRVAELVDRTPPSRNRYVDFLRAMSMLVVIVGHWLAAAPYFDATNTLTASHILRVAPWTAWLTWIVQVMPIFFMVGGYANGISWRAARRDGKSYAAWLEAPSRLANPPTSRGLGGDRCNRACARRAPGTDQLWL